MIKRKCRVLGPPPAPHTSGQSTFYVGVPFLSLNLTKSTRARTLPIRSVRFPPPSPRSHSHRGDAVLGARQVHQRQGAFLPIGVHEDAAQPLDRAQPLGPAQGPSQQPAGAESFRCSAFEGKKSKEEKRGGVTFPPSLPTWRLTKSVPPKGVKLIFHVPSHSCYVCGREGIQQGQKRPGSHKEFQI